MVETWDDTEVARRWLLLCPVRKSADGGPAEPSEPELNSIRFDADKVKTIRSRLSDISWWMRLLCQRIAQKANIEDQTPGKFWQNRYRAVRLIDDEAILACAAYVDLNPIRAGVAQTIEDSQFTSARLRLQTIVGAVEGIAGIDDAPNESLLPSTNVPEKESPQTVVESTESINRELPIPSSVVQSSASASTQAPGEFKAAFDSFLAPIEIDERNDPLGARASAEKHRCSDKGFLAMPAVAYLELLDWTARQIVTGKRGATPDDAPPIFERLKIKPTVWYDLVTRFGKLFSLVAGQPHRVDEFRGRLRKKRYHVRQAARELLGA